MKFGTFVGIALVAAAMIAPQPARAAYLSGHFWDVAPDTITSIDEAIAAVAGGTVARTAGFKATSIDYGDASTDWAVGSLSEFLNADAGSIVGTDVPDIQESVFRLTGSVLLENGQDVWVTSDDGFRLIIAGSLFSEDVGLRGPYSTTTGTWLGATGIYDVTLWYFEGHAWQGRLSSNLVPAIPVPASALLLISALAGLGVGLRRRRAAVA